MNAQRHVRVSSWFWITCLLRTLGAICHHAPDKAKVVHGWLASVSSLQDLINQSAALFCAGECWLATNDLMDDMVQICPNRVEDTLCESLDAVRLWRRVHGSAGGCCIQRVGSV